MPTSIQAPTFKALKFVLMTLIIFQASALSITRSAEFHCTSTDIQPNPDSCNSFYDCIVVEGILVEFLFNCPPGTKFDTREQFCMLVVDCGNRKEVSILLLWRLEAWTLTVLPALNLNRLMGGEERWAAGFS